MDLNRIDYSKLNNKEKENFNYHKIASALADYGYDSMRLNNDWEGADFIAVKGDDMIKVQVKSRLTINKKYLNKDLYIAYIEKDQVKIYLHDEIVSTAPDNIINSVSWIKGEYHWGKTPVMYENKIVKL